MTLLRFIEILNLIFITVGIMLWCTMLTSKHEMNIAETFFCMYGIMSFVDYVLQFFRVGKD